MSRLVDRRPAVAPPVVLVLRVLGAALLVAMAWIHLYLWGSQNYSTIKVIGPAFLLNAVLGFVLAAAVLVAPRRLLGWVAAAGALLQIGTFGALILASTVGLFGFYESTAASLYWETVAVELAGFLVLAVLALVRARESVPRRESARLRG